MKRTGIMLAAAASAVALLAPVSASAAPLDRGPGHGHGGGSGPGRGGPGSGGPGSGGGFGSGPGRGRELTCRASVIGAPPLREGTFGVLVRTEPRAEVTTEARFPGGEDRRTTTADRDGEAFTLYELPDRDFRERVVIRVRVYERFRSGGCYTSYAPYREWRPTR